ncbi:MAG: hypothetical protein WCS73_09620 [Lentisphaeria bacterium]
MRKKIEIDDNHSIELNSSMGWLFIYREQFGRDILPDLLPALETILELLKSCVKDISADGTGTIDFSAIDDDTISSAIIALSGAEIVTVLNIAWAMAKNADKSTGTPEEWADQFDCFPLDLILPEIMKIVISSSISSKNAKRLLTLTAKVTKSIQIES